ncbi:hypothetical protein ACT6P6_26925, partial [Priestia endophytica]
CCNYRSTLFLILNVQNKISLIDEILRRILVEVDTSIRFICSILEGNHNVGKIRRINAYMLAFTFVSGVY